jgi:hypothetical protein
LEVVSLLGFPFSVANSRAVQTTHSNYSKRPNKTEAYIYSGHNNTAKLNAVTFAAALPKGPDGSLRLALTTSEAAAALGVSVRTLHRLSSDRKLIKPSRALRTMVWPVAELVRFLEQTAA